VWPCPVGELWVGVPTRLSLTSHDSRLNTCIAPRQAAILGPALLVVGLFWCCCCRRKGDRRGNEANPLLEGNSGAPATAAPIAVVAPGTFNNTFANNTVAPPAGAVQPGYNTAGGPAYYAPQGPIPPQPMPQDPNAGYNTAGGPAYYAPQGPIPPQPMPQDPNAGYNTAGYGAAGMPATAPPSDAPPPAYQQHSQQGK
jgi:hypothetical protein